MIIEEQIRLIAEANESCWSLFNQIHDQYRKTPSPGHAIIRDAFDYLSRRHDALLKKLQGTVQHSKEQPRNADFIQQTQDLLASGLTELSGIIHEMETEKVEAIRALDLASQEQLVRLCQSLQQAWSTENSTLSSTPATDESVSHALPAVSRNLIPNFLIASSDKVTIKKAEKHIGHQVTTLLASFDEMMEVLSSFNTDPIVHAYEAIIEDAKINYVSDVKQMKCEKSKQKTLLKYDTNPIPSIHFKIP